MKLKSLFQTKNSVCVVIFGKKIVTIASVFSAQDGGIFPRPAEHQPVGHPDGASAAAAQSHQQSSK